MEQARTGKPVPRALCVSAQRRAHTTLVVPATRHRPTWVRLTIPIARGVAPLPNALSLDQVVSVTGNQERYRFRGYRSPYTHEVMLRGLSTQNTLYYYKVFSRHSPTRP